MQILTDIYKQQIAAKGKGLSPSKVAVPARLLKDFLNEITVADGRGVHPRLEATSIPELTYHINKMEMYVFGLRIMTSQYFETVEVS